MLTYTVSGGCDFEAIEQVGMGGVYMVLVNRRQDNFILNRGHSCSWI